MYIDDVLSGGYSYHEGLYWKFLTKDLMGRCGWVINIDKGQLPSQQAVYLGITIDTESMKTEEDHLDSELGIPRG